MGSSRQCNDNKQELRKNIAEDGSVQPVVLRSGTGVVLKTSDEGSNNIQEKN